MYIKRDENLAEVILGACRAQYAGECAIIAAGLPVQALSPGGWEAQSMALLSIPCIE